MDDNLEASNSWNSVGMNRPIEGYLYLYISEEYTIISFNNMTDLGF